MFEKIIYIYKKIIGKFNFLLLNTKGTLKFV